jgi:hypothetical protein
MYKMSGFEAYFYQKNMQHRIKRNMILFMAVLFIFSSFIVLASLVFKPAAASNGFSWHETNSISPNTKNYSQFAVNSDGSKMIATADYDHIYLSTNSGSTWQLLPSSPKAYWTGLTLSNDGVHMAAAGQYALYTSNDSGQTWTAQLQDQQHYWENLSASEAGATLYVNESGGTYKSIDYGNTWNSVTSLDGNGYVYSLKTSSDGSTVIIANSDVIKISNDGGSSWTSVSTLPSVSNWSSVSVSYDGQYMTAAYYNGLYVSHDAGVTWSEVPAFASSTAPSSVVVSSNDGTYFLAYGSSAPSNKYSNDSGTTWHLLPDTGSTVGLRSLAISGNAQKLVGGGDNSVLYTSSDGGQTLTTHADFSTTQDLQTIATSADGSKIYVGTTNFNGYMYHSSDSGATWTKVTAIPALWYNIATSADGTKTVALPTNNRPYISTDSGATWTEMTGGLPNTEYSSASVSADGTKMAVSTYSQSLYLSSDSGATWHEQTALGTGWNDVSISGDGTHVFAVAGNRSGVSVSTDFGNTWNTYSTNSFYSIASSQNGSRVIATNRGSVLTSSDAGVTWNQQQLPSSGPNLYQNYGNVSISADGMKMATESGYGAVVTSIDGGEIWSRQDELGTDYWHASALSSDGTRLYVVGANTAIYYANIYTSAPSAVQQFSASAHTYQTKLSWQAPASNGGSPIQSYLLTLSTDGGTTWLYQATVNASTFTFISHYGTIGQTVLYRIKALTDLGESAVSQISVLTPTSDPPAAPYGSYASVPAMTSIALIWHADYAGSPATDFLIEYKKTGDTQWLEAGHTHSAQTSFTVTGLTISTAYNFRITGINTTGPSDPYTFNLSTLDIQAPTVPRNVTVTTSDNAATLAWQVPVNTFGSLASYEIQYKAANATNWLAVSSAIQPSAVKYTITGLSGGTTYSFRIRALNTVVGPWEMSTKTYTHNLGFNPLYTYYGSSPIAVMANGQVAALGEGGVYYSEDSGATWQQVSSFIPLKGTFSETMLYGSPSGNYLIIASGSPGRSDYLSISSDHGHTWQALTAAGKKTWSNAVISDNGKDIYGVSTGDGIYASHDAGTTWSLVSPNPSATVSYTDALGYDEVTKTLYVTKNDSVNNIATMLKSTDNGVTWQAVRQFDQGYVPVNVSVHGTDIIVNSILFSDYSHQLISTSHDNGATWTDNIIKDANIIGSVLSPNNAVYAFDFTDYSDIPLVVSNDLNATPTGDSVIQSGGGNQSSGAGTATAPSTTKTSLGVVTTKTTSPSTTNEAPKWFSIKTLGRTLANGSTIAATPTFTGTTNPYDKITITVHSNPIICKATADSTGNWTCTLSSALVVGPHTVAVTVEDTITGVVTSIPTYIVKVVAAVATSNANIPSQKSETTFKGLSWIAYITAAVALIIVVIIFSAIGSRRKRT